MGIFNKWHMFFQLVYSKKKIDMSISTLDDCPWEGSGVETSKARGLVYRDMGEYQLEALEVRSLLPQSTPQIGGIWY